MANDLIYETLRNRIIAGQYEPGTQLKEEPLGKEFGLSRTPVRASLKKLVDDGLAVIEANRGVFVAGWTQWDLEEMFSLRELLEPHAALLAAQRAAPQDVAELLQALALQERDAAPWQARRLFQCRTRLACPQAWSI